MALSNEQSKMKFVTFSFGWDGFPIAYHLAQEGYDSIVGQVQDKSELNLGKDSREDSKDREARLAQYDGLLKKYPARKLVNALKKVKNKNQYFIFFDQNNLFTYAEELLEAGFTNGLFPTKADYDMEKNREEAMKFVEANYKVKIIPHQKFTTVEEAKQYVNEVDVPLVLQSEGDFVATICPVDDVELNHIEILGALDKNAKDYAKGQIILKEKLVQPIEITPQIVFYNGTPVFTDLDIETKNIGDGENNGNQVGCGSNIIIATEFNDRINDLAFPTIVSNMAKSRKGIFVWDISLYITDDGVYFGEFCSNRFGYDSLMTEMTMSGGAGQYFNSIVQGMNPLQSKFGAACRIFNLNRQADQIVSTGAPEYTWFYEIKSKDNQMISLGNSWDLGVVTGSGETFSDAVEDVYQNISDVSFKEKYTRTKTDFLKDYPTSIVHRFAMTNHIMFEAPDLVEHQESFSLYEDKLNFALQTIHGDYTSKMASILKTKEADHKKSIQSIREEIKQILNS